MTALGAMWQDIGFIRWPLTFSFLTILALSVWSAWRLFGAGARPSLQLKALIDAVLFWGSFAVISGVLGTLIGVITAAQAVQIAGEVSVSLLGGGIKVAILSSAAGMTILAVAALVWFALQLRWRQLLAAARDQATGAA